MFMNISIIIPIYNGGKYLDILLKNINKQIDSTCEVILIDDCSEDDSRKIISKYKENSNYKIFYNDSNYGVSYSRNIGLLNASKKYIVFIDSDDDISEDYFSNINSLISLDKDLIVFGTRFVYENRFSDINVNYNEYLSMKDVIDSNILLDIPMAQWVTNKVFKKDIICDNDLRFNESLKTGEDLEFMLKYFEYVEDIVCIKKCLYFYNRMNSSSLTRKNTVNIVDSTNNNNMMIERYFMRNSMSIDYLYKYKTDLFIYVFDTIYKSSLEYKEKIDLFKRNIEKNFFKESEKYCDKTLYDMIINNDIDNIYKYVEAKWNK